MFRSRKPRGQRSVRKIETEEDGEDMEVEEAEKTEIQAPKLKKEKKSKKEKKNKPKAALSFGDDDTEESGEFKVKKSNRSRKLAEKLRNEVEKESKAGFSNYFSTVVSLKVFSECGKVKKSLSIYICLSENQPGKFTHSRK